MPEPEDTELDKAQLADMTKKRIVYAIPNMEQVPVQKNITYKTADGVELQMDVYHPIDLQKGSLRPAVIFVHGDAPPEFLKNANDLMNHPEGQHSFDMLDDNARSREIIKATLEFIKAHLLKETM